VRLLVLDGSRVLPTVVARLAPAGVEVEAARTFAEARRRLHDHPPEALIVNISPAALPWRQLHEICSQHEPPIPVLYESCVYHDAVEAGLGRLSPSGHFLEKPYSIAELRNEVDWLVQQAEENGNAGAAAEPGGDAKIH
jgi:DNA-binding response OmpR family regulator